MTLKDNMAADLAACFMRTDEFADAATFYPVGGATGFACVLLVGDPTQTFVQVNSGPAKNRRTTALGTGAVISAGIAAIEGASRSAQRGDTFTIASGAYAGTWEVESAEDDDGGGVTMQVVLETRHGAAGPNVRRTS